MHTQLAWLLGNLLSPLSSITGTTGTNSCVQFLPWVLRIHSQVFVFLQQALLPLSRLSVPLCSALKHKRVQSGSALCSRLVSLDPRLANVFGHRQPPPLATAPSIPESPGCLTPALSNSMPWPMLHTQAAFPNPLHAPVLPLRGPQVPSSATRCSPRWELKPPSQASARICGCAQISQCSFSQDPQGKFVHISQPGVKQKDFPSMLITCNLIPNWSIAICLQLGRLMAEIGEDQGVQSFIFTRVE